MLISVSWIGLANIVAGKQVVPELIQYDATPEKIAYEAVSLLTDQHRRETMEGELVQIKKRLGEKGASERVAQLAYEMIGGE